MKLLHLKVSYSITEDDIDIDITPLVTNLYSAFAQGMTDEESSIRLSL